MEKQQFSKNNSFVVKEIKTLFINEKQELQNRKDKHIGLLSPQSSIDDDFRKEISKGSEYGNSLSQVNTDKHNKKEKKIYQLVQFNNRIDKLSSVKERLCRLQQYIQPIYEDFVYLTEVILQKTMKSANKQLQDTLMNYFLENHVSNLFLTEMNCISKREARFEIEKTMIRQKSAKYMNLLIAFQLKIKQFQKEKAYENLLVQLIADDNTSQKNSEQWKTLARKRILALLLLVHWQTPNSITEFNDFFSIWDSIYPNNSLPQKPKKVLIQMDCIKPIVKRSKQKIIPQTKSQNPIIMNNELNLATLQKQVESQQNTPQFEESNNQNQQLKNEMSQKDIFSLKYQPKQIEEGFLIQKYPKQLLSYQGQTQINQKQNVYDNLFQDSDLNNKDYNQYQFYLPIQQQRGQLDSQVIQNQNIFEQKHINQQKNQTQFQALNFNNGQVYFPNVSVHNQNITPNLTYQYQKKHLELNYPNTFVENQISEQQLLSYPTNQITSAMTEEQFAHIHFQQSDQNFPIHLYVNDNHFSKIICLEQNLEKQKYQSNVHNSPKQQQFNDINIREIRKQQFAQENENKITSSKCNNTDSQSLIAQHTPSQKQQNNISFLPNKVIQLQSQQCKQQEKGIKLSETNKQNVFQACLPVQYNEQEEKQISISNQFFVNEFKNQQYGISETDPGKQQIINESQSFVKKQDSILNISKMQLPIEQIAEARIKKEGTKVIGESDFNKQDIIQNLESDRKQDYQSDLHYAIKQQNTLQQASKNCLRIGDHGLGIDSLNIYPEYDQVDQSNQNPTPNGSDSMHIPNFIGFPSSSDWFVRGYQRQGTYLSGMSVEDKYIRRLKREGTGSSNISYEEKFIRDNQRKGTVVSLMSIESEKMCSFRRSDTRNFTGLSSISIESDKDRSASNTYRSKLFLRNQNSLDIPQSPPNRCNTRKTTEYSFTNENQEVLGEQAGCPIFQRNFFKQFSEILNTHTEDQLNYSQVMPQSVSDVKDYMMTTGIHRNQLRKRHNHSVDSLSFYNLKQQKDFQNLSQDIDNMSINLDDEDRSINVNGEVKLQ